MVTGKFWQLCSTRCHTTVCASRDRGGHVTDCTSAAVTSIFNSWHAVQVCIQGRSHKSRGSFMERSSQTEAVTFAIQRLLLLTF